MLLLLAAAAGPLLWAAHDLLVTGSPIWSLTATRDLAAQLSRPSGLGTAIDLLPGAMSRAGGEPLVVLAAAAGLLAACASAPRRRLGVAAAAVLCTGCAGYLVLGLAGLPLLDRYLLLPGIMLAILAAGTAAPLLERSGAAPRLLATVGVVALLACMPGRIADLDGTRQATLARRAVVADLERIAGTSGARALPVRCGFIALPDFRTRPIVATVLGADALPRLLVAGLPDGTPGGVLTYSSSRVQAISTLGGFGEAGRQSRPLDARTVAANASWRLYASAC